MWHAFVVNTNCTYILCFSFIIDPLCLNIKFGNLTVLASAANVLNSYVILNNDNDDVY